MNTSKKHTRIPWKKYDRHRITQIRVECIIPVEIGYNKIQDITSKKSFYKIGTYDQFGFLDFSKFYFDLYI